LASGYGSTRRSVDPVENIRGIAALFGSSGGLALDKLCGVGVGWVLLLP
jgi:hypothetical protein